MASYSNENKNIKYNIVQYETECQYHMTTLIWPEIQIGITFEIQAPHHSDCIGGCLKQNVYLTPEIKGIHNGNRLAYKILEIHDDAPNIRFAPNCPFFFILKKHKYYQYCKLFVIFINWLRSAKQKLSSNSSFVETLYNNSLKYDEKFTQNEKQYAKILLQEMDGLYLEIFSIQNALNKQINNIYTQLQSKIIYYDDDLKRKIMMKQLINKYFRNNISKHSIIYHNLHLTYFVKIRCIFKIILINEFQNTMNSHQYIQYIVKCLDDRLEGITNISQIVMTYCNFLLPLEKCKNFLFKRDKHREYITALAGRDACISYTFHEYLENEQQNKFIDGDLRYGEFRYGYFHNECLFCYFRKKKILSYTIYNRYKNDQILLDSFNNGIAYNVDRNTYYICH